MIDGAEVFAWGVMAVLGLIVIILGSMAFRLGWDLMGALLGS